MSPEGHLRWPDVEEEVGPSGRVASAESTEGLGPPLPCCAAFGSPELDVQDFMDGRPPALNDVEGPALPAALPEVIDSHVHLFPPALFEAIWRWFGTHGWPVRYRLHAEGVIRFLLSRGVSQLIALQYAHRPGMARSMNRWMTELVKDQPRVVGMATVFPGEQGAGTILDEAFGAGLQGLKLHCHVQGLAVDDPSMDEIYEVCSRWDRPLVIHAGREPKSSAYPVDPYVICSADRVARVLQAYPDLRICVPHLGADEFGTYRRLLARFEHVVLDTTMMMADYFPGLSAAAWELIDAHPDRVCYGSDFPNLPYAWDREIRRLVARRLPEQQLGAILGQNARRFYRLSERVAPVPPSSAKG